MRDAVTPALETSGLELSDIDGIFVGHFNAGFVNQDFTASQPSLVFPQLRHVPATRFENACATGSAAIWSALDAVAAGRTKRALVIGVEKMTGLPSADIVATLLK